MSHPYTQSQQQQQQQQQQHPYGQQQGYPQQQGGPNYAASSSQQSQYPPQQQAAYGAQAQPVYGAPSSNPYGQNQQYQQTDQQQYNQQQQQQQAYGQQQQQQQQPAGSQPDYPYGATQGDVAVVVPLGPPPGLMTVNDSVDRYLIQGYSTINLICIAICLFIAVSSAFSLIFEVDVFNIIFLVLAIICGGVLCFFTWETNLYFDSTVRSAKVMRKRLFQHFCTPETLTMVSFSDLGNAGFTGSPGVAGELYVELGGTRLVIARRIHQTDYQIASEVEPWQRYLDQKRGRVNTVGGILGALANAVAGAI